MSLHLATKCALMFVCKHYLIWGKLQASCNSGRKIFNLGSIAEGLIVSRHMTHPAKLLRDKCFLMNSASVWTLLINYHGFGFFSLMDAFVVLKKFLQT